MNELLSILDYTARQTQQMSKEQSVMGSALVVDGVTLIPVSKISCGFSFGGSNSKGRNDKTTAGAGAKVSKTPLQLIAIIDGTVQMLEVDADEANKNGIVNIVKPVLSSLKKKK